MTAQRLRFELVTGLRLQSLIDQEFGAGATIPDRAWADLVTVITAHLSTEHHLVLCCEGAEIIASAIPNRLRVYVVAPDAVRVGNLMLDRRLERLAARQHLSLQEGQQRAERRRKFRRSTTPADLFDLILNQESLDSEHIVDQIERAVQSLGMCDAGLLSSAIEAQIEFQVRLRLARHGIAPPGKVRLPQRPFAHQSEEIFANLLDFYRIAWEYEPRSFPLVLDGEGRVVEAFTPDFYLPEFDLYVELTTMKQSLVTRKNRKVRRLRELYPKVNIQVFYQKDIENLIFKYGLSGRGGIRK